MELAPGKSPVHIWKGSIAMSKNMMNSLQKSVDRNKYPRNYYGVEEQKISGEIKTKQYQFDCLVQIRDTCGLREEQVVELAKLTEELVDLKSKQQKAKNEWRKTHPKPRRSK